jgi:predicted ferric reductase
VLGLYAITFVVWALTPTKDSVSLVSQVAQLCAALALVSFAAILAISTRHRLIDHLFAGLDKAYVGHKWLGVSAVLFVIIHVGLVQLNRALFTGHGRRGDGDHVGTVGIGNLALILFLALILVALFAKRVNHEHWKSLHAVFAVPYIVGLVHYVGSSSYGAFSLSPLSLWLGAINLVGLGSVIYTVVLYEWVAFGTRYQVTGVRSVAKGVVEITGRPLGKALNFKPGQFTFVKFPDPVRTPSHPFTISSSPKADLIQFTIKNLGDHTAALVGDVEVGQEFALTAPHGVFDYTKGAKHQIWLAGGIGVTPFRSFYSSEIAEDFSIDFFYAYHGEAEGVYLDEMAALAKPNLRVHLIDDTSQGFLSAAMILEQVTTTEPIDIYFCGPKPMRQALMTGLIDSELTIAGFHYEEFTFGR